MGWPHVNDLALWTRVYSNGDDFGSGKEDASGPAQGGQAVKSRTGLVYASGEMSVYEEKEFIGERVCLERVGVNDEDYWI